MEKYNYSRCQLTILVILRLITGWHILYEGFAKLLNQQWTSLSFLQQSQGIFSGMARWITSNPETTA